jgi:hypothetical protein
MVAQWQKPPPDEKVMFDMQAEAEAVLSQHGRHAPGFLQGEQDDQYDRRLTYEIQKYAPNFKDLNLYDAQRDAYKILKQQVFNDALQEARHPTNIPEGTLKEVRRKDITGREYSEFYGKPSAWLSMFSAPLKRLVGIRQSTDHSYHPGNLG